MSGLIDTTEMYLRTIAELMEQDVTPMRARIAERLEQTTPTVSQTVARMERDGLLTLGDEREIHLTKTGREQALRVLRRHRVAECFLQRMGLPLERTHDEACRWEHVLTDEVERLMLDQIDHPDVSPYGCPIPTTDPDTDLADAFLDGVVTLSDAVAEGRREVDVVRLGEDAQRVSADLELVLGVGILPGAHLRLQPAAPLVGIVTDQGEVAISDALAHGIYVRR